MVALEVVVLDNHLGGTESNGGNAIVTFNPFFINP